MLPTPDDGTYRVIAYAAEVGGRMTGLAGCPNLLPEELRPTFRESGEQIIALTRGLGAAYVATLIYEVIDQRIFVGHGMGIDRGWDRTVSDVSDVGRGAVPDRNTASPEYRSVFEDGTTKAYTQPSIKQDPELAADLRARVDASGLRTRDQMLALIDAIIGLVGPASANVKNGEERVNTLFQTDVGLRGGLTNHLWAKRKEIEGLLGRSNQALARFVFFDFKKSKPSRTAPDSSPSEPAPEETPDS
jgi:hypothetical protein